MHFNFYIHLDEILVSSSDEVTTCKEWLRGRQWCYADEWQLCMQVLHTVSDADDELPF